MSVNCSIALPNSARLSDVAKVIGILAGLKPIESPISASDGFFFDVPGVTTRHCGDGLETCAYIDINAPAGQKLLNGCKTWIMFHFEFGTETADPDINDYCRGLLPSSTPFWCAVGRRLVRVFGGTFIPSDCDDKVELAVGAHPLNGACNGDAWYRHQRRLFEVQPLTAAEVKDAGKVAAYKTMAV